MVSIHQWPYGVNRTCLRIGLLGRRFAEGSLDSSLSNTIVRLALVIQRRLEDELRSSLGITAAQFRALDQIHESPGIGSAALGRALLITPQSAGAVVNGLIRAGFVQRDIHAKPGMLMGLTITPVGKQILAQATRTVERLRAEDEAPLSRQEAEGTQQTLSRLLNALTNLV
ncbi:MarR family winged helix-turn-helix transcriptional regulator [Alcaligenes aquatilis]|uniref:MarR family transcriptional regulator n=1 Tax=Alcaligenes aquatilis TaxID=323284 RepID=A0A3G2HQX6_9BURK|nr:MarR family transcriptional regulator [Alcaligenes aquatilis]AYN19530.1 MarR family transcriptional regulator [Alcaligenes aquatilis]